MNNEKFKNINKTVMDHVKKMTAKLTEGKSDTEKTKIEKEFLKKLLEKKENKKEE